MAVPIIALGAAALRTGLTLLKQEGPRAVIKKYGRQGLNQIEKLRKQELKKIDAKTSERMSPALREKGLETKKIKGRDKRIEQESGKRFDPDTGGYEMIDEVPLSFSTGGLLGNQKEIDADNDGEITDKDFALLRERKETGGLLEMDREEYVVGGLVKLLKQVPKTVSKDLPKGAADSLSADDAKQILKFVTDNDDSLPDLKMIARLGKDLDIKDFNLSDKQMREAVAMKELLEIANTNKGGKAKYLQELMDDEAFETFGDMFLFDDMGAPLYDTRLAKAEGGSSLLADDLEDMEDIEEDMESDTKMEDNYTDYILSEALSEEEQETLEQELNSNKELNSLFEKVMDVAQEFSGSGPVEGPGTGVSDSVPARLSDGEFVFTAKAVEEIGADTLMAMMKEAEAEADKRQEAYDGGPIKEEMNRLLEVEGNEVTDEINKQMMLDPYQRHVRS